MKFNLFASKTADGVAHPAFFWFCVLSVVVWIATGPWASWSDTHQLVINTFTTVVTYLLVALLHNDQNRFEKATNARLEEILKAIEGADDPVDDEAHKSETS